MKTSKMILVIALLTMAIIPACAQQQYNSESDFRVKVVDGGKGIEITGYVGKLFVVRIPPRIQELPVTSIGKNAFEDCENITSVIISNGVTSIGDKAFADCENLTSVTIPNSVTSIGNHAFAGCKNLTSITIPNSVTRIGGWAFSRCTSLARVTIGNSVAIIEDCAFEYCTSLKSVTIPNSVTGIGGGAFVPCTSLASVTFEGTIQPENFGDNYHYYSYGIPFDGDLDEKYFVGGKGTYTTTNPGDDAVWTKK